MKRAQDLSSYLIYRLPDQVMVDGCQRQLFSLVGRNRSPFQGISQWPWLNDLVRAKSQAILDDLGESQWRSAGGYYDEHGRPTLVPGCEFVEDIVRRIELEEGGMLWLDADNVAWAVRVESVPFRGRRIRFGYGITCGGSPHFLDPESRDQRPLDAVAGTLDADECNRLRTRDQLERTVSGMRLYARAEQILWLTHSQVLAQRSSLVLIPDVFVAEAVWGGDDRWPQDWRRDLMQTFRSLAMLHSEVLRLDGPGWQPRLGAHSVCLPHVELLQLTDPGNDRCQPGCPLNGTARKHSHFRVQIGFGFLGILEKFMVQRDAGNRRYDFTSDPEGQARRDLNERRRQGEILTTNVIAQVIGPAPWSGIAKRERRILTGLDLNQALVEQDS